MTSGLRHHVYVIILLHILLPDGQRRGISVEERRAPGKSGKVEKFRILSFPVETRNQGTNAIGARKSSYVGFMHPMVGESRSTSENFGARRRRFRRRISAVTTTGGNPLRRRRDIVGR